MLGALHGRKALLVDDDIRNVFALTSALEQYGMDVVQAENGRECIETLKRVADIDIVLMDLMMPDLDGYDTICIVRQLEPYRRLPIIAAAQVVVIETLHEHRLLDKRHFAHAFGRALDTLSPELRGGMTEAVLRDMRDRCLNLPAASRSDLREWLQGLPGGRESSR